MCCTQSNGNVDLCTLSADGALAAMAEPVMGAATWEDGAYGPDAYIAPWMPASYSF
jgi:hypothetical protein